MQRCGGYKILVGRQPFKFGCKYLLSFVVGINLFLLQCLLALRVFFIYSKKFAELCNSVGFSKHILGGLLTARQNTFKINLYANEIFLQFYHFGRILKHILGELLTARQNAA